MKEKNRNLLTIGIAVLVLFATVIIAGMVFAQYENVDFFSGIYWAIITVSTVGYGDYLPHSVETKTLAMVLVVIGAALFAYLGALLINFLISEQFKRFFLKTTKRMENHYIICGFNSLSETLIHKLKDVELVVVERDEKKIEELKQFENVVVVEGDAVRAATLQKAGVEKACVVVFCLSHDADCVVGVVEAKKMNPKIKCVVRIKDKENEGVLKEVGADQIICQNEIIAQQITDVTGGMCVMHK